MDELTRYLKSHCFEELFVEALGWDRASGSVSTSIDGRTFDFELLAQKRGFQVLHCSTDRLALINRGLLRKVQRRLAATYHEHIAIYTNGEPDRQIWQWAVRLPDGRRLRHREHPFFSNSPPDEFIKRLHGLCFTLEEEEELTLVDALDRVRGALDTSPELNLFVRRPKYAERSDKLARAMRNGGKTDFDRFVLFHRPLVHWVAKRIYKRLGLDLEDAEQIGMLGLIHAAKRYEPSRGTQFSTYATFCIEGFCKSQGPPQAQLIRIPVHVYWRCVQFRSKIDRLATYGPDRAQRYIRQLPRHDAQVAKHWPDFERCTTVKSLSLRKVLEYGQARRLVDPVDTPVDAAMRSEQIEIVRAAIDRLHPRYARVIRLRHGIGEPLLTLEQVAGIMGLTRERIRQIQVKADKRLRQLIRMALPEFAQSPSEPDESESAATDDAES